MRQFGLYNPLLNPLVEGMEIGRLVAFGVALSLCRVVMEGCDSGLELLVKQLQLLLLDDVFAVESHLLPLTIILQLFFHLLSHLVEHLKEWAFPLLQRLDIRIRLLR